MAHDSLEVFSEFYAVVLEHPGSGPLRWAPVDRAWKRLTIDGWSPGVVAGDAPREDQLSEALTEAQRFRGSTWCARCDRPADPAKHFICVGVLGEPESYCVQKPASEVVDSRGGTGQLKHWGTHWGCQVVEPARESASLPGFEGSHAVTAGYVYGRPLLADEVMERDWCSRCQSRAFRLRGRTIDLDSSIEDQLRDVRDLALYLKHYTR
ncbi:hypothetical protein I8D64_11660 [Brachybacterium sp. MASK1Z-5]|uniref:Uncharacterized protein n=1 Tax=Brachybacterium halotolerans TaxID=2795215 RepID=A0ABS1BBN9_9MICO|nr:hypothetical protein [Brachybacterium halotolerans]MBK0332055.1 hypothetical protein [Brachybacterium halotolerans]